jgi:hypothetical protein
MPYDEGMIDHYAIKLSPAANHKDIMKKLVQGAELAPDDLAKLSKVKAKLEIIGDYADMEKVWDLLKGLLKTKEN